MFSFKWADPWLSDFSVSSWSVSFKEIGKSVLSDLSPTFAVQGLFLLLLLIVPKGKWVWICSLGLNPLAFTAYAAARGVSVNHPEAFAAVLFGVTRSWLVVAKMLGQFPAVQEASYQESRTWYTLAKDMSTGVFECVSRLVTTLAWPIVVVAVAFILRSVLGQGGGLPWRGVRGGVGSGCGEQGGGG